MNRTLTFLVAAILVIVENKWGESAPVRNFQQDPLSNYELEKMLDEFLSNLYDKLYGNASQPDQDIYEQMQGDQPSENNIDLPKILQNFTQLTLIGNISANDYLAATRMRQRENDQDIRDKNAWKEHIKVNILGYLGRSNLTSPGTQNPSLGTSGVNSSALPFYFNSTTFDDQISEKIRSYNPSCEVPPSLDQDIWKDDNIMNLYFNFDYALEGKGMHIATATLRLYRIPIQNSTNNSSKSADCDNSGSGEEEKLLRISIYWYTKGIKQKKRVKRKLCDSKVIDESSTWVELSIRPAIRAWAKGRNLGLAVEVEDQDRNILKADKFFKGVSCTVGASTPKPFPTIIIDALRQSNELDRINGSFGRNSTSPFSVNLPMPPSIDICTLEFPENYSHLPHVSNLRINVCNLKKAHEQNQLVTVDREPQEQFPIHIRHQRQHLKAAFDSADENYDPRSGFKNTTILTKQLQKLLGLNISRDDR